MVSRSWGSFFHNLSLAPEKIPSPTQIRFTLKVQSPTWPQQGASTFAAVPLRIAIGVSSQHENQLGTGWTSLIFHCHSDRTGRTLVM